MSEPIQIYEIVPYALRDIDIRYVNAPINLKEIQKALEPIKDTIEDEK